ncbi:PEP-CTERM system TPR-repeat protein PrsT [Rheinheimera sp. UJ51]|uniref:XrtA/PEP-CTERM system TPR-repeat protein PrsT n=1 Tax=Rheinheimera sp. UJ51 TaxID=2892446 RepID=UPI001E4955FA|nr:XrtA/PEP-CTERM system TPR-repeat protein PrsT [Rheinheimera sp. UJ51]MCC5451114.1 PEP-CTERM system TPR-repeat protein PrsT [Rheinheimera sp. UJ51]
MKTPKLVTSLVFLAVLAACSKKTPDEHYNAAQDFINQAQYAAAAIELRSAIQQAPEDARLRAALAETMLKSGDSVTAEREFERALQYGTPIADIAPLLVKSYYLNNNFEQAANFDLAGTALSVADSALLDTYRALSLISMSDAPAAFSLFEALSTSSQADAAAFAKANVTASKRQYDEAFAAIETITADSPLFDESMYFKAKLYASQQQDAEAAAAFEHYVKKVPTATLAKLLLAQTYVRMQDFTKAEPQLDALLKQFPQQPYANHLLSIIKYEKGELELAKQFSENAVRFGMTIPESRIIAAMSAARLNQNAQALNMLEPIASELQRFPAAQRLYAVLQLNAGQGERAAEILSSLPVEEQNIELLAQTAFQLLRQGNDKSADLLLQNYQNNHSQDSSSLATLASIRLNIEGQRPGAIEDLEKALQLDPAMDDARMRLITAYIEEKRFAEIDRLTEQWQADPKTRTAAFNIKSYVALLQGDFEKANEFNTLAAAETPDNPFVGYIQAVLLSQKQDLSAATKRIEQVIVATPTYLPALEFYYSINRGKDGQNKAKQKIEQIYTANTQNFALRLLMAQIYTDNQQFDKTAELLSAIDAELPNLPPLHYLLLIDAHQNTGKQTLALQLAEKWYRKNEKNPQAAFSYANALTSNKEFNKALDIINTLSVSYPDNPRLQLAQIRLLSELKRYTQAISRINTLPEELKKSGEVQYILAQLYMSTSQPKEASSALKASYAANPTALTAVYLVDEIAKTSVNEAIAFIDKHTEVHGRDNGLITFKANLLIEQDADQAMSLFAEIVQDAPNLVTLNNYAWLLIERNQFAKAEPLVKQALQMAPNHPDILDTFGLLLLRKKDYAAAVGQFEKSLAIRPDATDVQLHYVEALIADNKMTKASSVLRTVSDAPEYQDKKAELQRKITN